MKRILIFFLTSFITTLSFCQKIETVYLNAKDSTANMYIAVVPQTGHIDAFMFLLDGFGNSPQSVLVETDLPNYAAEQNILTIIPFYETRRPTPN